MTAYAIKVLEKGASETRTMGVSVANDLVSGETIDAIGGSSVSPSGLTLSSIQKNSSSEIVDDITIGAGLVILFQASGGTAGQLYTVFIEYTTSTGDTKDMKCQIRVTEVNNIP